MDGRQARGVEIAKQARIRKAGKGYIVPSQSGMGKYAVMLGERPSCTCPDYELRGDRCKHVFAVEHMIQTTLNLDGSTTVTETLRVTETVKRTTYAQDWRAYNAAQT